jgi:hypothetical protein
MQTLKLSKAVQRVTLIRLDESGFNVPLVVHRRKRKRKKQSKSLRPVEKAIRKLAGAQLAASEVYLDRHKRSNRRKKNGWVRRLPKNVIRAQKKFRKKL